MALAGDIKNDVKVEIESSGEMHPGMEPGMYVCAAGHLHIKGTVQNLSGAPVGSIKVAGKSGISQARSRLGPEPVKALYEAVVAPIAQRQTRGAWFRQWRLMSLDGSTLDVADTVENDSAFGRPGASRGSSAYPKLRFVALLENGTHVLCAAQMDKYSTDELTLAESVVPALEKGMLCLADRFFPGYKLWQMAAKAGADIGTLPFKVLDSLFNHPLTDKGLEAFLKDYAKVFQKS